MLEALKRFIQLDRPDQVLVIRAWCWLGVYRFALRNRPLRSLLQDLEGPDLPALPSRWSAAQLEQARSTGLAISRAANHTPWLSNCLVQCLVARRLLQQQGIAGSMYVGVRKAMEQEQSLLKAHAWLTCGPEVISGWSSYSDYQVLAQQQWS